MVPPGIKSKIQPLNVAFNKEFKVIVDQLSTEYIGSHKNIYIFLLEHEILLEWKTNGTTLQRVLLPKRIGQGNKALQSVPKIAKQVKNS